MERKKIVIKEKKNLRFFTKFSHILSFGDNVVVFFHLQRCSKLHTFTIDYGSKKILLPMIPKHKN
jgi:hypothetical protein